uniref:Uncharacterized protein n=1 Tax=Megaselia scalaris TaxID=36166 RepID=T1GYA6_MEGSC
MISKVESEENVKFQEDDFARIWKGLYFCMWMSDKPLVQEELAEDLGKLVECFSTKVGIDFFGSFLDIMQQEWFGIDQWRMDKFLMLVRRMLRYTLKAIKKEKWQSDFIEKLNSVVYKCLESPCLGLSMHVLDIFFEELAKMGFPTKSIDDIELVKPGVVDDSGKNKNQHLDPRAGNVDVFMPILPLDADGIIQEIERVMYKSFTNSKSRKHLKIILENFKTYKSGVFPLGVKTMPILEKGIMKPIVEEELRKIEELDKEMHNSRRSLKSLSKKQRKRFLASLDLSEANENNIDEIIEKQLNKSPYAKKKKFQQKLNSLDKEVPAKKQKLEQKVSTESSEKNKEETPSKKPILKQEENSETIKKNKLKNKKEPFKADSEWDVPMKEGETEYFVPSKKIQIKKANEALKNDDLVPNPFAKLKDSVDSPKTPKQKLKGKSLKLSTPLSTPGKKKVRIVLKQNASQSVAEHIKQVRSSPLNPYDATKLPTKGLLKPNSMPGPINPYYKKKLKLSFNDTF